MGWSVYVGTAYRGISMPWLQQTRFPRHWRLLLTKDADLIHPVMSRGQGLLPKVLQPLDRSLLTRTRALWTRMRSWWALRTFPFKTWMRRCKQLPKC
jgi:hypothetical protein